MAQTWKRCASDCCILLNWMPILMTRPSPHLRKGSGYDLGTAKRRSGGSLPRTTPPGCSAPGRPGGTLGWSDQHESLPDDSKRAFSPQRFLARAISGYSEGVVNLQTVAAPRGISAVEASNELAAAGIVQRSPEIPLIAASDVPPVSFGLSGRQGCREHQTNSHRHRTRTCSRH